MRNLRFILSINWEERKTNVDVLEIAGLTPSHGCRLTSARGSQKIVGFVKKLLVFLGSYPTGQVFSTAMSGSGWEVLF